MQEYDDGKIRETLKLAYPAVEQQLERDLWPLMLRRMDKDEAKAGTGMPWFDWVLAGAVTVAFVFFPKLVLLLAYHL